MFSVKRERRKISSKKSKNVGLIIDIYRSIIITKHNNCSTQADEYSKKLTVFQIIYNNISKLIIVNVLIDC